MIRVLVVCDCCKRAADPGTGDPVLAASVVASRWDTRTGAKRWTVFRASDFAAGDDAPPPRPEEFEHYCPVCVDRRAGLGLLAQLVEDLRDDDDDSTDDDP